MNFWRGWWVSLLQLRQFWLSVGHFKHAFLFVQGQESFQVTAGSKRKLGNNMQWLANYVGHVCNQSDMVIFKPAKVCGSSSNSLWWWWSKKNGKAMGNWCLTGVFAWKKGTPKYPVVNRHPIPSRILHKMGGVMVHPFSKITKYMFVQTQYDYPWISALLIFKDMESTSLDIVSQQEIETCFHLQITCI